MLVIFFFSWAHVLAVIFQESIFLAISPACRYLVLVNQSWVALIAILTVVFEVIISAKICWLIKLKHMISTLRLWSSSLDALRNFLCFLMNFWWKIVSSNRLYIRFNLISICFFYWEKTKTGSRCIFIS